MFYRGIQRALTVKQPMPGHGGYAFEPDGEEVQAAVLPVSGTMTAQAYGFKPDEMRRLISAPDAPIERGQGVCVEVAPEADPDYIVLYAARWPRHTEAHLRYIPEGERGADE